MNELFCDQSNDSERREDVGLNSVTISSTTTHHHHHPQHRQVSQTIFLRVDNHHHTTSNHLNQGIIIDKEDYDDDDEGEVNDKSNNLTLDKHKIKNQKEGNTNGTDGALITLGLTCSECSDLIDTRSKLEQHLSKDHGKPFKCMIRGCNGQFVNKLLLSQHYTQHGANGTKLVCSTENCHFERSTLKSLRDHVYQYHEKGLFQCAACLVTYSHRFEVFVHHKKMHKFPQNKAHGRFSCQVVKSCQFVGRTKWDLKVHQLTHTQLRPFQCTWQDCGYSANQRGNVIHHIRVKHLNIPGTQKEATQRNIQCDLDPKQFLAVAA